MQINQVFNRIAQAVDDAAMALWLPVIDAPTRIGLNVAGVWGAATAAVGVINQNPDQALGGLVLSGAVAWLFSTHGYAARRHCIID